MKVTLFLVCDQYDSLEYAYIIKGAQEADTKWNLYVKYLKYLREIEGEEYRLNEYFAVLKQKKKTSLDILRIFGDKGKDLTSYDYLQKCWSQIKGNELLKIHFASWFEMTGPLVLLATERWKEKENTVKSKNELEDETDMDYGDDEDEDTEVETQDGQTQKLCKRKVEVKEGERTKAALAAERAKKRRRLIEKYGRDNLKEQGW